MTFSNSYKLVLEKNGQTRYLEDIGEDILPDHAGFLYFCSNS